MFMSKRQDTIRLIKEGHTAKEIAQIVGWNHESSVHTIARSCSLKVAKANTRKLETIRHMVADGKHYDEIAEVFGVSTKCMMKYCNMNKIYATPKPREKGFYKDSDAINALAKYNQDWEYVGGYTGSDGFMVIKHSCGYIVRKSCVSIRHNPARCEVCETIERKARAKEQTRQKAIAREVAKFYKPVKKQKQIVMKECMVCGGLFFGKGKYCSDGCSAGARKHYDNNKKRNRYIKAWTPESKTITLPRLYERDNGVCWICGGLCDYDADPNDNNYPSIDHVIPIARGGKDEWENIRLAHRLCNSLKGATMVEKYATDIPSLSQYCG